MRAFILAALLAAAPACLLTTDEEGNTTVDWERQSRLLEAEAQAFTDLGIAFPERAETMNKIAAALNAASDAIATVSGQGPDSALEAIDAALTVLLPYLDDANEDVRFAVVATRSILNIAKVYIEDDFDGDVPFEPGDVPPQ